MSTNGKGSGQDAASQCDEILLDGVLDNLEEIGYGAWLATWCPIVKTSTHIHTHLTHST